MNHFIQDGDSFQNDSGIPLTFENPDLEIPQPSIPPHICLVDASSKRNCTNLLHRNDSFSYEGLVDLRFIHYDVNSLFYQNIRNSMFKSLLSPVPQCVKVNS